VDAVNENLGGVPAVLQWPRYDVWHRLFGSAPCPPATPWGSQLGSAWQSHTRRQGESLGPIVDEAQHPVVRDAALMEVSGCLRKPVWVARSLPSSLDDRSDACTLDKRIGSASSTSCPGSVFDPVFKLAG
jgi:hypothetical protein